MIASGPGWPHVRAVAGVSFPGEALGPFFPAPQLQHKLVEPRRHLLSLYPVRY
jgi:hypothetical protein